MTNPTPEERARNLLNTVEQLLMQRMHDEAEHIIRAAIRAAELAARRDERAKCVEKIRSYVQSGLARSFDTVNRIAELVETMKP